MKIFSYFNLEMTNCR